MTKKWSIGLGRAFAVACSLALAGAAWAEDKKDTKEGHGGGGSGVATAKIGQPAPDFTLKTADGKTIKLADHKDKVVVLEWCNNECPFSHKEGKAALPKMKELAKEYGAKGVTWLGVDSAAAHEAGKTAEWYKEHQVTYPILMDTDGTVGHKYGAATTPHIFIINKGTLVYMGAHDDKGSRNYISESLEAIMTGKPVPVAETKPYGCSVKYGSKAGKA